MEEGKRFNAVGLPRCLVDDIAANLSDEIIEGKIQPGQQIIEADLQRALGVSRAPLREALLKLEGQGLVKIIPRKGSFIRPITPRLIRESFAVRAWLEGLAARLTSARPDPARCDRFDVILADMGRLAGKKDFKAYFYRHGDFHRVFIEGSDNETLIERIGVMRREALWLSYSITYFEHHHQESQETHKRIIELFRKNDSDGVELAVRSHILDATDAYVRFLRETYPDLPGTDWARASAPPGMASRR